MDLEEVAGEGALPSWAGAVPSAAPGTVLRWTKVPRLPEILYTRTLSTLQNDGVLVCGANSTHLFDPHTESWSEAPGMGTELVLRAHSTLADGRVLLSGGAPTYKDGAVTACEAYDPTTETWTAVAPMGLARCGHAQATLADGRVLVCGGRDHAGDAAFDAGVKSAEIYDPQTDSWAPVADMSTTRDAPAMSGLKNGRALVTGGTGLIDTPPHAELSSAEIYDPTTDRWTPAAPMAARRAWHGQCTLSTGTVLVCGGKGGTSRYARDRLASAELYHPETDSWIAASDLRSDGLDVSNLTALSGGRAITVGARLTEVYGPVPDVWTHAARMRAHRAGHAQTTLADGRVLVSGGVDAERGGTLGTTEIYDPVANAWGTAAPMRCKRQFHTQSRLGDGRVLVCGGHDEDHPKSTELYDPVTDEWTDGPPMYAERRCHAQCTLADGRVLVSGGWSHGETVATAEIFHPDTGRWFVAAPMLQPRDSHAQSLLPTGQVLLIGHPGYRTAEIYDPSTDTWVYVAPIIEERDESRTLSTLADGRVLACGGFGTKEFCEEGSNNTAEIYDPSLDSWTDAPQMREKRTAHSQSTLLDGRVLVCGGLGPYGTSFNTVEICDPSFAQRPWSRRRHRLLKAQARLWVFTVFACIHRNSTACDDTSRLPRLPPEMWFLILGNVCQGQMLTREPHIDS